MKRWWQALCLGAFLSTAALPASAACPLCKAKADATAAENREEGKSLNAGIMYLLVMPYLLAGAIGYWWYVNQQKQKKLADDLYE
ncbi:MAG: hypothetical protein NZL95_05050 [Chitinophagales bacterium]|nr:hypothetical protein [Chitinophagales bacterium]MDW8427901.1 hypothetical protein [Chitinophagales bacterium]